jgi:hypothetical protein
VRATLAANCAVQTTSSRHDVDVGGTGLQGLHERVALGVRLAGEFLEGDLLVRVLLVPPVDHRAELVGVVLAHGEGDGAAAVGAAGATPVAPVVGGAGHQRGTEPDGRDSCQDLL